MARFSNTGKERLENVKKQDLTPGPPQKSQIISSYIMARFSNTGKERLENVKKQDLTPGRMTPGRTSLTLNYSSDMSFRVYSSPSFELVRSGRSLLTKPDMKLNRIISYKAISEMRDYSKEYAEEVVGDVLTKVYPVK